MPVQKICKPIECTCSGKKIEQCASVIEEYVVLVTARVSLMLCLIGLFWIGVNQNSVFNYLHKAGNLFEKSLVNNITSSVRLTIILLNPGRMKGEVDFGRTCTQNLKSVGNAVKHFAQRPTISLPRRLYNNNNNNDYSNGNNNVLPKCVVARRGVDH